MFRQEKKSWVPPAPPSLNPGNYQIQSSPPLTWISLQIKIEYETSLYQNLHFWGMYKDNFSFNTIGKYTDSHNLMVLIVQLLGFLYTSFVLKQWNTALFCLQRKGTMQKKKLHLILSPFPRNQNQNACCSCKIFWYLFWVCKSVSGLTVGCWNKFWRHNRAKITAF